MSDETLLERYIGNQGARASEQPEADCADCRAFGWLRGVRDFARMLELRRRDGNIVAVDYARLERAEFNPSEGITLTVGGQTIRIRGRNLNAEVRPSVRLFEGITRHRVSFIREADRSAGLQAGERETLVDAIEW